MLKYRFVFEKVLCHNNLADSHSTRNSSHALLMGDIFVVLKFFTGVFSFSFQYIIMSTVLL